MKINEKKLIEYIEQKKWEFELIKKTHELEVETYKREIEKLTKAVDIWREKYQEQDKVLEMTINTSDVCYDAFSEPYSIMVALRYLFDEGAYIKLGCEDVARDFEELLTYYEDNGED